jgi:DNA-binding CsgD family transcriptional regulator
MKTRGRPRHPDILTPREFEVLGLLQQGLTNPQIAERLGISLDGVKYHVREILGKLDLSNREEAALWQRETHRPWWASAALAPVAMLWKKAGVVAQSPGALATGAAGVLVGGAVAGLAFMAFLLATGGGDGDGEADAASVAAATPNSGGVRTTLPLADGESPASGLVYLETHPSIFRIAVFDADRMTDVASFELDGSEYSPCDCLEGLPFGAALAGERVIVNRADRVVSYGLDGSDARTVRHAPPGGLITGIAVSPDHRTLAITELTGDPCPETTLHDTIPHRGREEGCLPFEDFGQIVLIDLASGAVLHEMSQSVPGLDDLQGRLDGMSWFGDSSAFVVQVNPRNDWGDFPSGAAGAREGAAIVGVDGSVRVAPFDDRSSLTSPDGRYVVTGEPIEACDTNIPFPFEEATIYDLQAGAVVAADDESRLIGDWVFWSPDGSELLYTSWASNELSSVRSSVTARCLQRIQGTERWAVLHADGSPAEMGVDRDAVMSRWYGNRLLTYSCPAQGDEAWFGGACAFGDVHVALRGQEIATTESFEVLGWVDSDGESRSQ